MSKPAVSQPIRWNPPYFSTFKINVDASVFNGENHFSIGMVLRDHLGQFVRRRVGEFVGRVSVLEAEPVGILEALRWSSDISGHMVAAESDSQLSVKVISSTLQNQLELENLVEQCRLIIGVKLVFLFFL